MATVVTLAEAKVQLRILDTWHDLEVQAAVDDADAIIRGYLKDRNDDAWTDTTAPREVKRSVLLMTAHLYEHRGDEFGPDQDNDDRVWNAIANLLRRLRDPAVA